MQDGITAGIEQEGEGSFLNKLGEEVTETSQESPAESKPTEQSPTQEGEEAKTSNTPDDKNVPFDQHPRWIERDREWQTRLTAAEEREKVYQSLLDSPKAEKPTDIPTPFIELFGDNAEAYEKWQELSRLERGAIKAELVEDQKKAERQVSEDKQRWLDWVDTSIKGVELKYGIDFKNDESTKNELMKIAVDYLPTDESGNVSFEKAYDLMLLLRKDDGAEKSQARKKIAASTASDSKAETPVRDYFTPEDFGRRTRR